MELVEYLTGTFLCSEAVQLVSKLDLGVDWVQFLCPESANRSLQRNEGRHKAPGSGKRHTQQKRSSGTEDCESVKLTN